MMAWKGDLYSGVQHSVEMGGLYWHFVDIIWIYLFPLLYLMTGIPEARMSAHTQSLKLYFASGSRCSRALVSRSGPPPSISAALTPP